MPACPPTCPKVRQQLRKALQEGEITPPLKGHLGDTDSVTSRKEGRSTHQEIEENERQTRVTDYETAASRGRSASGISKDSSVGPSRSPGAYSDSQLRNDEASSRSLAYRNVQPESSSVEDFEDDDDDDSNDGNMDTISDWPHEFCEKTCPLEILKERIKRKLADQQRIVDHYFLTKGFNYFDDVCTCTLSCVFHSLKRDSFVRSLLASAALFALGIKLCYEMNHWYLPARFS